MGVDMNVELISKVEQALGELPIEGRELAARIGLKHEEAYQALVWLYENDLAYISRTARTGKINGWVAA